MNKVFGYALIMLAAMELVSWYGGDGSTDIAFLTGLMGCLYLEIDKICN